MVGASGDVMTTEVQGTALERRPHIVPPYRRSAVTPASTLSQPGWPRTRPRPS